MEHTTKMSQQGLELTASNQEKEKGMEVKKYEYTI